MAFGLYKNGANSTDKRMIRKYVRWGWSIDQIANKLSIVGPVIQRVINFQAILSAKQIGEQPENVRTANIPAGPDDATLAMMHAQATGGAMQATVGGGEDGPVDEPPPVTIHPAHQVTTDPKETPALVGKPLKTGKAKTEDK